MLKMITARCSNCIFRRVKIKGLNVINIPFNPKNIPKYFPIKFKSNLAFSFSDIVFTPAISQCCLKNQSKWQ